MKERLKYLQNAFEDLQASSHVLSDPLSVPIFQCFNWMDVFEKKGFTTDAKFYVVIFRTVRSKDAENATIQKVDATVQKEAKTSGGLLLYWSGTPNSRRECLSTSIWESREAADKASQLNAHTDAAKRASEMYDSYIREEYWLSSTADNFPAFELVASNRWRA
eukprot:c17628_g2_i2 orf=93-581(-)